MDHLAIMNSSWKLIPKMVSGEKTIESRWSVNKISPWKKVKSGEKVYFKDSGKKVSLVAVVSKVLYFDNLNEDLKLKILKKYGERISIDSVSKMMSWLKNKKYASLIFLKNPKVIKKPFDIDKRGFGSGVAWIVVNDINRIKI